MKKTGIIYFSLLFLLIFFPEISKAGSCKCDTDPMLTGQSQTCYPMVASCNDLDPVIYRNCVYFGTNDCTRPEATGYTEIDQSCTTVNDCNVDLPPGSYPKCIDSKCYLDEAGYNFYKSTNVSFLGIEKQIELKKPILQIRIPELVFTDVKTTLDSEGYIHIPYIGEYMAAIYKLALGMSSIVAVIVIILNGFRIVISAGGDEKRNGIKKVTQALLGLFILWSSYALFYTINPNLVQFRSLSVRYVDLKPVEEEEEITTGVAADEATIVDVEGVNIQAAKDVKVSQSILDLLQQAAKQLQSEGITLYVSSGYRSYEGQVALINENCNNPPGSATCDPKQGRPLTCMLVGNKRDNCPHTTGKAIDVWGMKEGKQCIMQRQCGKDPNTDPCRKDPCQARVIEVMKQNTFCSLSKEAWHFESPKMSSSCN